MCRFTSTLFGISLEQFFLNKKRFYRIYYTRNFSFTSRNSEKRRKRRDRKSDFPGRSIKILIRSVEQQLGRKILAFLRRLSVSFFFILLQDDLTDSWICLFDGYTNRNSFLNLQAISSSLAICLGKSRQISRYAIDFPRNVKNVLYFFVVLHFVIRSSN